MWGGWEAVSDGPGTPWSEPDAGWDDPEELEGCDDDEFGDV